MPEPFPDLGNVGAVLERVGRDGGAHDVGSELRHEPQRTAMAPSFEALVGSQYR